jgi:hypothetical protein
VVLLECYELTSFSPSRIKYYYVFKHISILTYTIEFIDFGPITVFDIHHQSHQLWAHRRCQQQALILLTLGSLPLSRSSINLADFRLIAVVNVKG